MAYTATAFTQPLADLLRPVLRSRRHIIPFTGEPAAPSDAAFAAETDDRRRLADFHFVQRHFVSPFRRRARTRLMPP
jgi:hypothetical protein